MINFRMLRHSDIILWISVALLIIVGIMMIFSCTFSQRSREGDDPYYYVTKQLIAFIIGLVGLSIFTYLDYAHLKTASWFLYALAVIFLFIVLFKGFMMLGAQRWIALGPVTFQPSEISKLDPVDRAGGFFGREKGADTERS